MRHRLESLDRGFLIRLVGAVLVLIGLAAAFIGPIEVHTYYLFVEGGRFHFPGFGFGSLMFGNITMQVVGYYAIALLCISLGVGHLKLARWSRKVTLALLWDWLILGLPLSVIIFLMLVTSKDLSRGSLPGLILLFLLLYPALPTAMVLFYQGRGVTAAFESSDCGQAWCDRTPQPVLVLGTLLLIFLAALHIPFLFNGVYPLFGRFLYGMSGFLALDASVMVLACLAWGVLSRQPWAWWGTGAFLVLMALSATITFLSTSPQDLLANMRFAVLEMDALRNVPLRGGHLVFLISLPLYLTFLPLALSKKHFQSVEG